jgi:myosin protein heavy chain
LFSSQSPFSNPTSPPPTLHNRTQSTTTLAASLAPPVNGHGPRHQRADSKSNAPGSTTFAPSFIKTEDLRRSIDVVKGIEGENDFSGRRYVWLRDPQNAFVKGWVVEELEGGRLLVQCDDGSVSESNPERHSLLLTVLFSSVKSIAKAWIRSTLPNSTRQMIWLS